MSDELKDAKGELSSAKLAVTTLEAAYADIKAELEKTKRLLGDAKILLKAAMPQLVPTLRKWSDSHSAGESTICQCCSGMAATVANVNHEKDCVYVSVNKFLEDTKDA